MDIDFILNGKKPKKQKTSRDPLLDLFSSKPKQSQGGLMDLFVGQGHPRPGDRVTKPQRKVLRNKRSLFGDWDSDGVINGLDCQPRNPKKHMARYLSANKKVVYGHNQSHYSLDPVTYEKEVDAKRPLNQINPYKESAIRFSTGAEAHFDTQGKIEDKNKIIARIGGTNEFFENMDNRQYQKRFMKGISAIESQDNYNDETPIYNEVGRYLGRQGEIKKMYENQNPDEIIESKQIDTDKAYKYRKSSPGNDDMKIHRRSSYNYFRNNPREITPIEVDEDDYNKEVLRDGKHRIIAAKNRGVPTIQVHIHKKKNNPPLKVVRDEY